MDRRILVALHKLYPQGIPPPEFERALATVEAYAAGLVTQPAPAAYAAPKPVAKPTAPPRRRGRPPKAKPARVAPPAAVSPTEGEPSRAAQARAALAAGPLTAPQLQEALELEPNAAHPLLARIGAKVAGEVEDAEGNVFKTYALPVSQ